MKKRIPQAVYVILILLSLTPILWFIGRPEFIINGVDTNFPLNPLTWFLRRLFVWNGVANAGADFSSSTAGLFFHFVQLVPYTLGANLQIVQIVSLIFWFAAVIFSSYLFARTIIPQNRLAQIVFVVLYSFNTYLFNTWENVKVANLALVVALPFCLALLLLFLEKKLSAKKLFFCSLIAGIFASGGGINPAYFSTLILGIGIFLAGFMVINFSNAKRILMSALILVTGLVLINSFWAFPTFNFLLFSGNQTRNIADYGFINWLSSLSQNTSLFNVLRLQGAWDWYAFDEAGGPLYIPYALNFLRRFPFVVFSVLLVAIAFLSLLWRQKQKKALYISLAGLFVISVFLSAGAHPPTGGFYIWLTQHLPFFSFFRSPWYIFTPLYILASAALIALFSEKLAQLSYKVFVPFFFILIIGNLVYTYPLVTGKIFRAGRSDSFYINFPEYIFDSYKEINTFAKGTRIISYPDDEIEQFKWGYRGIDSILNLGSEAETLFVPLNQPESPIAKLTKEFYKSLKRNNLEKTLSLAAKLNIGWIFEKRDQKSLTLGLPDFVKNFNNRVFGEWAFYQIPEAGLLPKIYAPQSAVFAYPFSDADKIVPLLDKNEILFLSNDSVVNHVEQLVTSSGKIVATQNQNNKEALDFILLPSTTEMRTRELDFSKATFEFEIPTDGIYQPYLESYKIEEFELNTQELAVEIDGKREVWRKVDENESFVFFSPVQFSQGSHTVNIAIESKNTIKKLDSRSLYYPDSFAMLEVENFDPFSKYYIEFEYKHIHGNNPAFIFDQRKLGAPIKNKTETLPIFPDWVKLHYYFEPVVTNSELQVILNTPAVNDPIGTKIAYQNAKAYRVFENQLFLVSKNQNTFATPEIVFKKSSPVAYSADVKNAKQPHIIVFSENYSPKWNMNVMDKQGNKLILKPLHFSANLYANAWYIAGTPDEYKFEITYGPQRILYLGAAVSLVTMIVGIVFLFK